MHQYIKMKCEDCLQCCHFHLFKGQDLSLHDLEESFFYTKELADTFFPIKNNLYHIGETCLQSHNDQCTIHNTKSFPSLCALFPLMATYNNDDELEIVIDCNCPEHTTILKNIEKNRDKVFEQIDRVIKSYHKTDSLLIIDKEELIECGYELKTIRIIPDFEF